MAVEVTYKVTQETCLAGAHIFDSEGYKSTSSSVSYSCAAGAEGVAQGTTLTLLSVVGRSSRKME